MDNLLTQITVRKFIERKKSDIKLQLVDVRESEEFFSVSLEEFIHLPLSQIVQWFSGIGLLLDPSIETVVVFHHGVRSAQMCYWLTSQGFVDVKNLLEGIDAYSMNIDTSVPRY